MTGRRIARDAARFGMRVRVPITRLPFLMEHRRPGKLDCPAMGALSVGRSKLPRVIHMSDRGWAARELRRLESASTSGGSFWRQCASFHISDSRHLVAGARAALRKGGLPADHGGVIALTPVYLEGWTARPTMSD